MAALAGSLLAQVKRPTHNNSLQYAASVAASLCQSHVSVMCGLHQPVRLCLAFSTRLHLCLHDWWREGGNKCLCGKQMRERTQPTWKTRSMKFIPLSLSLHNLNHVKLKTNFCALLVLYLERCVTNKIWKLFCVCVLFLTALFMCQNWLFK